MGKKIINDSIRKLYIENINNHIQQHAKIVILSLNMVVCSNHNDP